jgi:hypothetical protein
MVAALFCAGSLASGAPVRVSFDCNNAKATFTPQQQQDMERDVIKNVVAFCAPRLKPWEFSPEAVVGAAELRLWLKDDPGLSLCATLSDANGELLADDAVEVVKPGAFFPPSSDMAARVPGELLDKLLKQSKPKLLRGLVQGVPVGSSGQTEPEEPATVEQAFYLLPLDLARFSGVFIEMFKIEGTCGSDGRPVVLSAQRTGVETKGDGDDVQTLIKVQCRGFGIGPYRWENLDAKHLGCLKKFKISRVLLFTEPVVTDAPAGAARAPAVAPAPPH